MNGCAAGEGGKALDGPLGAVGGVWKEDEHRADLYQAGPVNLSCIHHPPPSDDLRADLSLCYAMLCS